MKSAFTPSVSLLLAPMVCALGCAVHEPELDPEPLRAAAPAYHEHEEDDGPAELSEGPWWSTFGAAELDALVADALDANLDLRAFVARIEQADALVRRAGGRLWPQLDVGADYAAEWDSQLDDETESASVGVDLSWELDLWGRLRSARNAARFDAAAARRDWEAGCLLLSASVAEAYFEILEQHQALALLDDQIRANETLLELTRLRFGQGQSSIVDVLQQREQLASTRALIPAARARLEALQYALDVLVGVAPGERPRLTAAALPAPPPLPDVGIPSALLVRRPDLIAARDRVVALDYLVGEAIADRLPRLQVGGSVAGVGDPAIDTLVASGAAGVLAPLFDAGTRAAEVDARDARLAEAIADFSQAFLTAVQEVETALVLEREQAEEVTRLEAQFEIARQLLTETRNRYSQGLTDYLPVLAAVVTVQDLERTLITSRRRHLSFRVALHLALGGPMPALSPSRTVADAR